jgi:xylulokinase
VGESPKDKSGGTVIYLGIDIGTSAVKAVVTAAGGAIVADSEAPLAISRPRPGWSEQDPADWWRATNEAVLSLAAPIRQGVSGIGLSGQMHGATLLDNADHVLRPAILWNDGRSAEACGELERRAPALREITGNLAMPGFTAPKLVWLRANERDVFDRVAHVLLPKDYVRLCMTGEYASDMSDSAGTLWLDVAKRRWSDDMLAACDMTTAQMPALFEGSEPTGMLRAEVADAWGMGRILVAAGGGDNAASAVGMGIIAPGDAFLSLGTSGVLFAASDRHRANPARTVHAFCHALPERWHQMSVILSAASCLAWITRLTGAADETSLLAAIDEERLGTGPELFLPYLSGERTPHNDPHARGVFFGLDHDSDAPALARAVLEGVAFAVADGADALTDADIPIEAISVVGGGARSRLWGRILAAVLDRPLTYREGAAASAAVGAARLAQLAADDGIIETVCTLPPAQDTITPDAGLTDRYAGQLVRYRRLYENLKNEFTGGNP